MLKKEKGDDCPGFDLTDAPAFEQVTMWMWFDFHYPAF